MKFQSLFRLALVSVLSLAVCLPATSMAKSKKWRANNNSQVTVKVFWTATGCADVTNRCDGAGNIEFVCKHKELKPGEDAHYKFEDSTSNRKKKVCAQEGPGIATVRNTSKRKKNGIRLDSNGIPEWYDE